MRGPNSLDTHWDRLSNQIARQLGILRVVWAAPRAHQIFRGHCSIPHRRLATSVTFSELSSRIERRKSLIFWGNFQDERSYSWNRWRRGRRYRQVRRHSGEGLLPLWPARLRL